MTTSPAHETGLTASDDQARDISAFRRARWALRDIYAASYLDASVWRCPSHHILNIYNTNIAASHLEVIGDGGLYLERARLPAAAPRITLLDTRADRLAEVALRLGTYRPATQLGSVLEPVALAAPVESIGLTSVLHGLPGTLDEKARAAFGHLRPLLVPGGRLFGATVLADAEERGLLARCHIAMRNRSGVFSNAHDRRDDLERALRAHFRSVTVYTIGAVALFSGRA